MLIWMHGDEDFDCHVVSQKDLILFVVFISGHPDPPALARDIAKRNGFHSLGPLLKYVRMCDMF